MLIFISAAHGEVRLELSLPFRAFCCCKFAKYCALLQNNATEHCCRAMLICYRVLLQNNATEQCYRTMLPSIATEVQSIVLLSNTTELCYTAMPQ